MMKNLLPGLALLCALSGPLAAHPAAAPPAGRASTLDVLDEVEAAIGEYKESYEAWRAKLDAAEGEEAAKIKKQRPIPARTASGLWKLVEREPLSEGAARAMTWIHNNPGSRGNLLRAREALLQDHLESEWMADVIMRFGREIEEGEAMIDKVLAVSPHERVQAVGQLAKASHYLRILKTRDRMQSADEKQRQRTANYYGQAYMDKVMGARDEVLGPKAEGLLELAASKYKDVKGADDRTVGAIAEGLLFARRHLKVGAMAPEIEGTDVFGESFKLSDYRGKVVMLDFWGDW